MKIISVFNNKGGVGKTTLTYHLAHALAALGHKTLIIDLDPQCNLTILGMEEEKIHDIWKAEDEFVEGFQAARDRLGEGGFANLIGETRSIHFLMKPSEDGAPSEIGTLPPPHPLAPNLDLIPGRLTLHMYEDKIASRWSDVYQGDPLAIRTLTNPRNIAKQYAENLGYKFVILDTSPSLGTLNKVLISIADGFLIPCMPDMFSLYGVRNIGNALTAWKKQFETIYHLLSGEKRALFPSNYVKLLGFTIFNAKRYANPSQWNLATAHYNYATQIPEAIKQYIPSSVRGKLDDASLNAPIGGEAIMHTHNTLPSMAQKYHLPIWQVPSCSNLDAGDKSTILGNRGVYEETGQKYKDFATALLTRISALD